MTIKMETLISTISNPKYKSKDFKYGKISTCGNTMCIYIHDIPELSIKLEPKSKSFDIDFGNGYEGKSFTTIDDLIYEIALNNEKVDEIEEMIYSFVKVNHF